MRSLPCFNYTTISYMYRRIIHIIIVYKKCVTVNYTQMATWKFMDVTRNLSGNYFDQFRT